MAIKLITSNARNDAPSVRFLSLRGPDPPRRPCTTSTGNVSFPVGDHSCTDIPAGNESKSLLHAPCSTTRAGAPTALAALDVVYRLRLRERSVRHFPLALRRRGEATDGLHSVEGDRPERNDVAGLWGDDPVGGADGDADVAVVVDGDGASVEDEVAWLGSVRCASRRPGRSGPGRLTCGGG